MTIGGDAMDRQRNETSGGIASASLPLWIACLWLLLVAPNAFAQPRASEPAMPDSSPPERVVLNGTVQVPLELERGLPLVRVRVNGRGPFRFGIETGARLIGISPSLVDSLHLPRLGADSTTFRVDSLAMGAARLEGLHVTPIRTVQSGVDGLLGLPAFESLLLTIDYPARQVVLGRGALPEPDGRDTLPMTRVGPFWGVPITIGDRSMTAILDTRSTGGLGLTPGDTAKVRWAGPLAVIGQARGAAVPVTPVLGGRLAMDVILGRHVLQTPFVAVRALPPDFPQQPIVGARVLQNFAITLDQLHARVRFARAGDEPIVLPEPGRPPAAGAPKR